LPQLSPLHQVALCVNEHTVKLQTRAGGNMRNEIQLIAHVARQSEVQMEQTQRPALEQLGQFDIGHLDGYHITDL
jgi:hypothetical protein